MKVNQLLPIIKETNMLVVIEIPRDEKTGHHSFIYGLDNITQNIMEEDVCFIIPYERLNRLIIGISNGEMKCRSSMYLELL